MGWKDERSVFHSTKYVTHWHVKLIQENENKWFAHHSLLWHSKSLHCRMSSADLPAPSITSVNHLRAGCTIVSLSWPCISMYQMLKLKLGPHDNNGTMQQEHSQVIHSKVRDSDWQRNRQEFNSKENTLHKWNGKNKQWMNRCWLPVRQIDWHNDASCMWQNARLYKSLDIYIYIYTWCCAEWDSSALSHHVQ